MQAANAPHKKPSVVVNCLTSGAVFFNMATTTGVYKVSLFRRAAMNAIAGPSNEDPTGGFQAPLWDRKILSGDIVLLKLPNSEIRSIKLDSDTYVGRVVAILV